jgi:hypothetical protein
MADDIAGKRRRKIRIHSLKATHYREDAWIEPMSGGHELQYIDHLVTKRPPFDDFKAFDQV